MDRVRVAIAGASGIGRHHAKWHHAAGAEVVAFLGSSKQSCAQTAPRLRELFPFTGRGYTDWARLLDAEKPAIADVCVPNESHRDIALAALDAGCHVLCEKPLVWQPDGGGGEQSAAARAVVDRAREAGRCLGVCTQYSLSLPLYRQVCGPLHSSLEPVRQVDVEMETLARGRQRTPAQIWVDMGPHPLSLLLAWLPDARLVEGSIETRFVGRQAQVSALVQTAGEPCVCRLAVRDREGGSPIRRFGVNGLVADCEGRPDAGGTYRSVLRLDHRECVGADFMSLLVADFHAACRRGLPPQVSGEVGLRNLELQVEVMRRAGQLD